MPVDMSTMAVVGDTDAGAVGGNTAKFFSKNLTGTGKSTGLLNDRKRPGRYVNGMTRATAPTTQLARKENLYSGNVKTQVIPFAPLFSKSVSNNFDRGITLAAPDTNLAFEITDGKTMITYDAYLDLIPQGALLVEDSNGVKMERHLDINYMMVVTVIPKNASQFTSAKVLRQSPSGWLNGSKLDPFVLVDWSYAPLDDALDLIERATSDSAYGIKGAVVDQDELAEWMDKYDLHDRIAKLADIWDSNEIGAMVALHIQELFANGTPSVSVLSILAAQLLYLESYNVPLSSYRLIHDALQKYVADEDIRNTLSKQNMQLLMNHALDDLERSKPSLPTPPRTNGQAVQLQANQAGNTSKQLSIQQRNAVDTDEPLVLVQAGAGTGKSTVIIERIENLVARGVDASEITVLSFTNAAADNITDRNPNVGSMTIAKMVHEIYQANYPQHGLSTIDTILNSLEIFYPMDAFAEAFRVRLQRVSQSKSGAMTELSNFIGRNMDQTITVLNTIKQVCLEIEVIMAYHLIETMVEPANISSRYLIIDEVQDNSIFEFVYLLKYVTKHQENMFIVGG